jgi:hypothetical protein
MKKKLPVLNEEKETVWNKSVYHDGNVYTMYTTDKSDMLRALKLAEKHPDDVKIIHDDQYGMMFTFSMSGGSLFWKPKQKRKMTNEQRQAASERLRAARENKT